MKIFKTNLQDVLVIEPRVFGDERGFFLESYNREGYKAAGIDADFIQDNHSGSKRGVLRGIHYQIRHPQGKLVRVLVGEVFDVAVDLRRSSSSFGQWEGIRLSAKNRRQLWVPPGFGHGFLVLSDWAEFAYKVTDYYAPDCERSVIWNDPDVAIQWPIPIGEAPGLSAKDRAGSRLSEAEVYP